MAVVTVIETGLLSGSGGTYRSLQTIASEYVFTFPELTNANPGFWLNTHSKFIGGAGLIPLESVDRSGVSRLRIFWPAADFPVFTKDSVF